MKEEKDQLRDFMQGVFHDYEALPEPEDWNRIEKTLSKRKRRRILPWIIRASAACLLLLLALYTGGILHFQKTTTYQTAVNQNKVNNAIAPTAPNTKLASKESVQAGTDHKTLTTILPTGKPDQNKVKANATVAPESKTVDGTKPMFKVAAIQSGQLKKEKIKEELIQKANTGETSKNIAYNNLLVHAIIPRQIDLIVLSSTMHDKSKDFSYAWLKSSLAGQDIIYCVANVHSSLKVKGLSLSNNSGMIFQSSGKDMMSTPTSFASQVAANMSISSVTAFKNAFLSSTDIGKLFQNNSRNYLPPVTFGLNVNFVSDSRWNIETGIQYTRLQSNGSLLIASSKAIQISTSFGYQVVENLHYIGIPFIINYKFAQKRKTSYYLSTGISIEKGLTATYKATPDDNFPGMAPIYSHDALSGMQYSMQGGIGISYAFIRHFELFGQPSVTYYFNSTGINTIVYSEHPLIFNLRTGIRYTIK